MNDEQRITAKLARQPVSEDDVPAKLTAPIPRVAAENRGRLNGNQLTETRKKILVTALMAAGLMLVFPPWMIAHSSYYRNEYYAIWDAPGGRFLDFPALLLQLCVVVVIAAICWVLSGDSRP